MDLQIILVFSTIDVATNHDIDHGKLVSPPYLGEITKRCIALMHWDFFKCQAVDIRIKKFINAIYSTGNVKM